ncbi:MAG: sigma factor-like helix-turn-helix DNA-binding protein [Gaiellaceae bacterium]
MHAHYGLGRSTETLGEIGDRLGLSAERVRQLEDRALEKLRDAVAAASRHNSPRRSPLSPLIDDQ